MRGALIVKSIDQRLIVDVYNVIIIIIFMDNPFLKQGSIFKNRLALPSQFFSGLSAQNISHNNSGIFESKVYAGGPKTQNDAKNSLWANKQLNQSRFSRNKAFNNSYCQLNDEYPSSVQNSLNGNALRQPRKVENFNELINNNPFYRHSLITHANQMSAPSAPSAINNAYPFESNNTEERFADMAKYDKYIYRKGNNSPPSNLISNGPYANTKSYQFQDDHDRFDRHFSEGQGIYTSKKKENGQKKWERDILPKNSYSSEQSFQNICQSVSDLSNMKISDRELYQMLKVGNLESMEFKSNGQPNPIGSKDKLSRGDKFYHGYEQHIPPKHTEQQYKCIGSKQGKTSPHLLSQQFNSLQNLQNMVNQQYRNAQKQFEKGYRQTNHQLHFNEEAQAKSNKNKPCDGPKYNKQQMNSTYTEINKVMELDEQVQPHQFYAQINDNNYGSGNNLINSNCNPFLESGNLEQIAKKKPGKIPLEEGKKMGKNTNNINGQHSTSFDASGGTFVRIPTKNFQSIENLDSPTAIKTLSKKQPDEMSGYREHQRNKAYIYQNQEPLLQHLPPAEKKKEQRFTSKTPNYVEPNFGKDDKEMKRQGRFSNQHRLRDSHLPDNPRDNYFTESGPRRNQIKDDSLRDGRFKENEEIVYFDESSEDGDGNLRRFPSQGRLHGIQPLKNSPVNESSAFPNKVKLKGSLFFRLPLE